MQTIKSYPAGLRYFYLPTGQWYAMRVYKTLKECVADYFKLFVKPEIAAVRIFHTTSGRFPCERDLIWHDNKMNSAKELALCEARARLHDAQQALAAALSD